MNASLASIMILLLIQENKCIIEHLLRKLNHAREREERNERRKGKAKGRRIRLNGEEKGWREVVKGRDARV